MSVSSPNLRKVLGTWRTLPTPVLVVVIVDYRGGWTENVLRDALFSLLGTNQKCVTRTKWFQHWFPNGNEKTVCCVSKFMSFTVGSYRRREGERSTATELRACRSVIRYKSSFTCHVLLGSCLLSCWVLFKELQGEISLFLIMILCYLAPAARYSSQFTFQVFFPKAVFGFTQALQRIFRRTEVVVCHIWWSSDLYKQFRNTNGFVSAVWWILSFGTQITSLREQKMSFETDYSSLWLSTVLS